MSLSLSRIFFNTAPGLLYRDERVVPRVTPAVGGAWFDTSMRLTVRRIPTIMGRMDRLEHEQGGVAAGTSEQDRLQAAWLEWVHTNLGRQPVRSEAAATAARQVMDGGGGISDAYAAARSAWPSMQRPEAASYAHGQADDGHDRPAQPDQPQLEVDCVLVLELVSTGAPYAGLVIALALSAVSTCAGTP